MTGLVCVALAGNDVRFGGFVQLGCWLVLAIPRFGVLPWVS
jgi:hypothetical protein